MTELCLIRHGQTDWNLTGRWQGQVSDALGLNDTGYAQAIAVREQLTGKFSPPFIQVTCSAPDKPLNWLLNL
jgi:broad specificity phosphatase PhoE